VSLVRALDLAALAAALALVSTWLTWWISAETPFLALVAVVSLRLLVAPVAVPEFRARRVLLVGMALYAVGFSFVTVSRHYAFRTHALDLGYYVQLVWNLARGHGPYVSLPEMHAWGDHLSPIVYLFVPLFWLLPGPGVLLIGQSVALALGAAAVFGIARLRLGDDRPAAVFAVLYLMNPSLQGINVRDFHAAALAIPLVLAAIFFAETERWWLSGAAVLLLLACREDAALAAVGLGAWLTLGRRRFVWGGLVTLGALAVLAADVYWIIPHFRDQPYAHLARYARFGTSLGGIVEGLLLHPLGALMSLLTLRRLIYAFAMLAPLGFLPALGRWDLVGAVPALAQNLLSSDPILYNHRTQYQAFVLPFLVLAAIGGYARLARRTPRRFPRVVLGVAMAASLALGAGVVNDLAMIRWWPTAERRATHALLARVPPEASVSAQERYVPHLSLRPLIFVFPSGIDRSEYVVLNQATYPWRNLPGVTMERAGASITISVDGQGEYRYTVAVEAGTHLLLRRL
jgi:uncharacterized membrane protein